MDSPITKGRAVLRLKQDSAGPLATLVTKGLAREETIARPGGRMYASSAGICARRNWFNANLPERQSTVTPASTLYMAIGEAVHKEVQDALFRLGVLLFSEYNLPPVGFNIGGRIDAIIVLEGKIVGVEIKTCGTLPSKPKFEHIQQANIYSAISGLPVFLLYVSRNVASYNGALMMREFSVDSDPEEALFRVALSQIMSTESVLPSEIPEGYEENRECRFCPFKSKCWTHDPHPSVSLEKYKEYMARAKTMTASVMDGRRNRLNGVLVFLQRHGTVHARMILEGSWDDLLNGT